MTQVLEWDTNFDEPQVGDKVVMSDTTLALIRTFNSETDTEADVIGVIQAKTARYITFQSGFDGPLYAMYGQYVTDEDLSQPTDAFGAQIPNSAAQPINPYADTRLKFVATGKIFTAVKKPYTGTPNVVMTHTNYDWCLI